MSKNLPDITQTRNDLELELSLPRLGLLPSPSQGPAGSGPDISPDPAPFCSLSEPPPSPPDFQPAAPSGFIHTLVE